MLESWYKDFVVALRGVRKSPLFFVTAMLTLAIGIGANTAVFTLLYGLLLRSLPVSAPQELARISLINTARPNPTSVVPYGVLQQLRRQQQSFVDISAWRIIAVPGEDRDGSLRQHLTGLVSGNAFDLLGLRPRLGRMLGPSDDVRGGPREGWPVVISHGLWQNRFGSDPNVLGTTLKLSNTIATIVGVAPSSFHGVWPGTEPELYLPIHYVSVISARDDLDSPTAFSPCSAIGRLKPGVSFETANAEIAVYEQQLFRESLPPNILEGPFIKAAKLRVDSARTGLPTFFGVAYSAPLYLMQGLVGIVLLLCCINVSGLMISKVHERQHEFAVRNAIGASRMRLIRQYLTESFVVALAGAALGAAIAWRGSVLLLPFFRDPNMHFGMSVTPDTMVFVITAVSAVATTLFFGVAPALRAGRTDPGTLLKARTAAQRQRIGRGFVAIQVALSLVLISVATLLSQSLVRLRGEDTGFDVDHVTIQTPPFHLLPQKGDAKLDVYQRMVDRIEQSGGVSSAAVTWYTPMTGSQADARFTLATDGARSEEAALAYNEVGPGYFRTMKTSILQGREFDRGERGRDVCVLNQAAERRLFGRVPAIGGYVRSRDPKFRGPVACRVIGVAADAKFASLREPPPPTVYFPMSAERADGNLVFLINAPTKAQAISAYRDALRAIAPAIPFVLFATLREQMDAALGSQRAITFLSTFFGAVALLLSAIGLYGMVSSHVTQRTSEIGVRVAIGASRASVLRLIFLDALRPVLAGLVVGAIALGFAMRTVTPMLYGVAAFDPLTLGASVALLIVVALAASLIPARRAASVDPMQAMRAE